MCWLRPSGLLLAPSSHVRPGDASPALLTRGKRARPAGACVAAWPSRARSMKKGRLIWKSAHFCAGRQGISLANHWLKHRGDPTPPERKNRLAARPACGRQHPPGPHPVADAVSANITLVTIAARLFAGIFRVLDGPRGRLRRPPIGGAPRPLLDRLGGSRPGTFACVDALDLDLDRGVYRLHLDRARRRAGNFSH